MEMGVEEGDMPTTQDGAQTTLEKLTSLWVRMDGLFERIKGALESRRLDPDADPQEWTARGNFNDNSNRIVEHSKLLPWLMMCGILSGFAVAFSTLGYLSLHDQLVQTRRAFDLLDLQIRDQNAILIREGLKQPTDLNHGPAGNYQYEPRRK